MSMFANRQTSLRTVVSVILCTTAARAARGSGAAAPGKGAGRVVARGGRRVARRTVARRHLQRRLRLGEDGERGAAILLLGRALRVER